MSLSSLTIKPLPMMIEFEYASTTVITVLRAKWLVSFTSFTVEQLRKEIEIFLFFVHILIKHHAG